MAHWALLHQTNNNGQEHLKWNIYKKKLKVQIPLLDQRKFYHINMNFPKSNQNKTLGTTHTADYIDQQGLKTTKRSNPTYVTRQP